MNTTTSSGYPLITIGIPTYNRCDLVCRAIRSALSQSYPNFEIVVSNNASTDNTATAIRAICDTRIKLLEQSCNVGMIGNFNACLEGASGEYFLMLSDDDLLEPDALLNLSTPFRDGLVGIAAKDVGVAWSPTVIVTPDNASRWTTTPADSDLESGLDLVCGLFNGIRGPRFCSILVRSADARAVGGYMKRHNAIADCGNWCRIALGYKYAYCARSPQARYTMHPISVTAHSIFSDWIRGGKNLGADCELILEQQGNAEHLSRLRQAERNNISNLIISILLQRPFSTWLPALWAERNEVWKYLFTPMMVKRTIMEGWKLLLPKRTRHQYKRAP